MLIDPFAFFSLIIIAIVVSISLIFIVAYVKVLKKYNLLLEEEKMLKAHDRKRETEILENAREKAAKIIGEAMSSDEKTKKEFHDQLRAISLNEAKDFEKAANDLLSIYKQELEDLKINTIKVAENITKDIEGNTVSELKDFKEILKKETYASQKTVEGKIEEDYQQVKKEVEAYRKEQIKKVEEEIFSLIQNVSTLVLGKSLSFSDHEEIVIEALEKAKKEKAI